MGFISILLIDIFGIFIILGIAIGLLFGIIGMILHIVGHYKRKQGKKVPKAINVLSTIFIVLGSIALGGLILIFLIYFFKLM